MKQPIIANQTVAAINAALQKDQGATFRRHLRHLMPLAEDVYNDQEDPFRTHLGASLIGLKCDRELWYSFHWAIKPNFEGRILRLFNRGHMEEPRMVALLLMIGCTVWQYDENGNQFRIQCHYGHGGGSLDGVVLGIPEIPNEPLLTEFKTHADKSFQKVKKMGVQQAKFKHFIQMQMYMGKHKLNGALYMAVNKNNDELYCELVEFDQIYYSKFEERFGLIIDARKAPKRISDSPGWYECRFCDYKNICHGRGQVENNCRTCAWANPICDTELHGAWQCQETGEILTKKEQMEGCVLHTYHSDLP